MKIITRTPLIVLVAVFFLVGANLEAYDDQVGRISHLQGKIYFQSGRTLDWLEGYMNSPVQEGDRIWTDINSYAEIQLDGSLFIRLDGDTKLDISRIGSRYGTICKLWLGSAFVRIINDVYRENPIFLETPDGSIEFMTKGLYRIDVQQDNTSLIRIYEGVADIKLQGTSLSLRQGESLRISNGERISGVTSFSRSTGDSFTRYNDERDELLLAPESTRYVDNSLNVGVYDLDYYGIWVHDASYGYCWRPRTFVGWVPYRFGRWIWVHPWGWTWISLEPWGWLPYHYGYWHYSHYNGWMWKPGNHYGPSWVAWTAHGSSVGWVPLHPDDPPYYHWNAHSNPPNYTHYNSDAVKPRNVSLHIGINASTHLTKEAFESGKVIQKNTDILSVNRDDIKDWNNTVPKEFKPDRASNRKPAGRMPSKTLREQSRAKVWTDDRTVDRDNRPSNTYNRPRDRSDDRSSPTGRTDNGDRKPSSNTRDRDNTNSRPVYDRSSRPDNSNSRSGDSTPRDQENKPSSSNDNSLYQGRDYQGSRSNFSGSDRDDRSAPSYRRPYDSSRSKPSQDRSTPSSDSNSYSRPTNDRSNSESTRSRSSGSSNSGSKANGSRSTGSKSSGSKSSGSKSSGSSSKSSSKSSKSSDSSSKDNSSNSKSNSSRNLRR